jgi:hypothetical protein
MNLSGRIIMEKQILTKLDFISMKTAQILDVYKKLTTLEIEDKTDTEEYKNLLETLELLKEDEDKAYDYFKNDIKKAQIAGIYLSQKSKANIPPSFITAINVNYKEAMQSRILQKLSNIVEYSLDFIADSTDTEMLNISGYGSENLEFLTRLLPLQNNETTYCLGDLINFSIDSVKKNDFGDELKNKLIRSKYLLSFLSTKLENYNIKNKFQSYTHTFNKDMDIEHTNISSDKIVKLNDIYGFNVSLEAIKSLVEFSNDAIKKNNSYSHALIILTHVLSVGLIYMSDEAYTYFQKTALNIINSESYNKNHHNHDIIKEIIIQIITNRSTYKEFVNQDLQKEKDN